MKTENVGSPLRVGAFAASVLLLAAGPGVAVRIDGGYPLGVVFQTHFHAVDTMRTHGVVPAAFHAAIVTDDGGARIRHRPNDGKYLVSFAEGSYMERTVDSRGDRQTRKTLRSTSEFDALGYAKSRADDAADLIPIFPKDLMSAGGSWQVQALVNGPFGTGPARYDYHVLSVETDTRGHAIATFSVLLHAKLTPPKMLAGWSSQLAGTGTIVWDCTEHQRVRSTTHLAYAATQGARSVTDVQDESDVFVRVK